MKRPYVGLALAVALYVGLRALVLHTAFDSLGMTMYELYPMGTVPRMLLDGGVDLPLRHYYDNAAGQLVTALLAVPFYAVLGSSYLALKLVPFMLGLGALVLTWSFLRRELGERAALLGALLFALAPATLVKYSLKASGNHYENVFFTMFAVWALWRVHAGGNRTLRLWVAGYAMGLAIFVFLGAIIPVGLLFLVHLGLVGWRRFGRDLVHGAPAFLLGVAPLIWLNLSTRARGAGFLGAKFAGEETGVSIGRASGRFADFFLLHLPESMTFPSFLGVSGRVADGLFLALFALAWGAALPGTLRACRSLVRGALGDGARPPREALGDFVLAPFVLYVPLTGLAFAISNLRMGGYTPPLQDGGYRYFIPTLLFACMLIAALAARWIADPRRRPIGLAVAVLALGTGLFDLGLIDPSLEHAGHGTRYDGHYMKQAARTLLGRKQGFEDADIARRAETFGPIHAARVYEGLGFYRTLAGAARPGLRELDPADVAGAWPAARRPDAWRGAGTMLRRTLDDAERAADVDLLLERWEAQDPRAAEHALEGLAIAWDVVLASKQAAHLERTRALLAGLSPARARHAVRGLGIDCGRTLRRGIAEERERIAAIGRELPAGTRPEFLRGLGIGLADGGDRPGLPDGLEQVVDEDPEGLLTALRARLRELFGEQAAQAFARVEAELPESWRETWERSGS